MSSSEDSDDDGNGFTRCIPPLPARVAIHKHATTPTAATRDDAASTDDTTSEDDSATQHHKREVRERVFNFIVDGNVTDVGRTLEPKYVEMDIEYNTRMSSKISRFLNDQGAGNKSVMYTNYTNRLSILTRKRAINKTHIIRGACATPPPSYPLEFFFGPDTDTNRLMLTQATNDLNTHGKLLWGCPADYPSTEWDFFPSGEFTASFLSCMERDWNSPMSKDPLYPSLKLYQGYGMTKNKDSGWGWHRMKDCNIHDCRRSGLEKLTDALRKVVSPHHKAAALGFAHHKVLQRHI